MQGYPQLILIFHSVISPKKGEKDQDFLVKMRGNPYRGVAYKRGVSTAFQ